MASCQKSEQAVIIFPCFALQRLQDVLADLYYTFERRSVLHPTLATQLPFATILIDSPLALSYNAVYAAELLNRRANGKYTWLSPSFSDRMCSRGETPEQLIPALFGTKDSITRFARCQVYRDNQLPLPQSALTIILASSGMCHAGRVVSHLKRQLHVENTSVVLTG